jgi:hypothetical protein
MVIEHLFVSDHSEQEMCQTNFAYTDFAINFIKHILISLTSFSYQIQAEYYDETHNDDSQ